MKGKLKVLVSSLLVIALLIPCTTAFAANTNVELKSNIEAIESYLTENNTDVVEQLDCQLDELQSKLINATGDEKENLEALIATTEELINEYQLYKNMHIVPRGSFHLIYSPAVAAVIAYFNLSGYKLSAELLTHAKDNDIVDSYYYPSYGSRVTSSSVYNNICNNSSTSGSASFPNSGSTEEKDLYYALHAFSYTKNLSTRYITIMDRYDFALGDYDGIAGIAVDTMYMAQEAGTIVPFQVRISRYY